MTERLLTILIMKAGPNLARILAQAILSALRSLSAKTDTEVDDELVEIIARYIEDSDLLAPAEK